MSILDMNTLSAAFRSHTQGSDKFTRRMAIALAEMDGTTPRQLVLRCERLGLLKEGSWDWFASNGGIIAQVALSPTSGASTGGGPSVAPTERGAA